MQTAIRLKLNELDYSLFKSIKSLFKNQEEIEISISTIKDFNLNKNETEKEYWDRIRQAIKNLEQGKNIEFTEVEFDGFVNSIKSVR
ncbi:MAG: hypothetical protein HW421_3239 [Ignavibacteria bacterium]|nr:hypothetical protein [Ignavibacteria bacterium]